MILGDFVKSYRKNTGMSMQEFADNAKLSKAYISILERNYNPQSGKAPIPSLETIKAVSNVIGADFNNIIAALDEDQEVSLAPLGPSPEALEVAYAYDAASGNVQAAVRMMLTIDKDEYYFATAAKGKGRRETTLTEAEVEGARQAIKDLDQKQE